MSVEDISIETDIGEIQVLFSGQVQVASGLYVTLTSGTTVRQESGVYIIITGQGVLVSGQGVLISGQGVTVSGDTVVVASGAIVNLGLLSGLYTISEAATSGDTVVVASGAVQAYFPPTGLKHGYTLVGAQSGGIELSSGAVVSVKIKNVSQSSKIWVGSAADPVQSGEGYLLTITAGDNTVEFDIDDLNRIYVLSEVSGGLVSWMGEAE